MRNLVKQEKADGLARWQALYDESTEPPKPIPLHKESPQWRHDLKGGAIVSASSGTGMSDDDVRAILRVREEELDLVVYQRDELRAEVERLRARCEVIPILLGEIELLRAAAASKDEQRQSAWEESEREP